MTHPVLVKNQIGRSRLCLFMNASYFIIIHNPFHKAIKKSILPVVPTPSPPKPRGCYNRKGPAETHDYRAGFSRTTCFTRRSYDGRSFLKRLYASACAGDSGFGSLSRSWIPRRICLIVIAGFQASSSFRIERQTVPEG